RRGRPPRRARGSRKRAISCGSPPGGEEQRLGAFARFRAPPPSAAPQAVRRAAALRLERPPGLVHAVLRKVLVDVLTSDRRELAAVVRADVVDAAIVAARPRAHQEDAFVRGVLARGALVVDFAQPADVVAVGRLAPDDV